MQAYLGTIVCKFGGDPVIACECAGNYSMDGQTDTTYHEPFFQNPAKSWELGKRAGVGPDRYMTISEHRAYLLWYIGTNYFGTCQGPFRNIG